MQFVRGAQSSARSRSSHSGLNFSTATAPAAAVTVVQMSTRGQHEALFCTASVVRMRSGLRPGACSMKRAVPSLKVVIRADQRLRYADVRRVMRVIAQHGVEMLNVVAHVGEGE